MFNGVRVGIAGGGARFTLVNLFGTTAGIAYDFTSAGNLLWRYNLLTWTEQFDNAAWQKGASGTATAPVVTPNAALDPNGEMTADLVQLRLNGAVDGSFSWLYQNITVPSGTTRTTSFFVKAANPADIGKIIRLTGATNTSVSLTADWQRISNSALVAVGAVFSIGVRLRGFESTADSVDLHLWAGQFENGSVATTYQKITDPDMDAVFRCPQNPLYQDTTGSMAVTTPDETVGLALDTSRGLALGPELVTNGDFSAGATGWTPSAWVIASGNATATATSTSLYGGGVVSVSGQLYRIDFDVVSYTSGTLAVTVGGNYTSNASLTGAAMSAGRKTVFVSSGANLTRGVEFYGGTISASIDNISVRAINSVPLLQANAGLRPKWGIAPASRRNLMTKSAGDTDWAAAGTTPPVVTNGATFAGSPCMSVLFTSASPTGYAACRAARNVQVTPWLNGVTYAQSIDVALSRALVGGEALQVLLYSSIGLLVAYTINAANSAALAGGAFARISMTGAGGGTGAIWPVIVASGALASDVTVYTKDIQIEVAPASAYQTVGSTIFNITQAGLPSYGYSRYDLVDDVMSATIPTAQTGDTLVFGRNGSWIESGVTYGAGSTFSIGASTVTGTVTGLPFRSLTAIGDVVGVLAIGRTLSSIERQNALSYYMARGAAGWLVAGAEMLTNGNFATDLTGWTNENITRGTSTWVAGQAFLDNTGTGNTVLWQSVTTVIGQPYLVSWDAAAVTAPATARCFAGTSSTNGSNFSIISPTPPSSNRAIFVATATTTFISVVAFGATGNATFDNVSLKPLVIA